MRNNNFRRPREGPSKTRTCSCGASSKLVKRRNYPHGRKSKAENTQAYKCKSCNRELSLNNKQEDKT